ncbi:glycosyltransferase [uncultured Thiothrix sp.]|uniref:glycosyltransferase n=1 Tax=uncultured Thiothrix sp. TaxID=223185 RepID=UPI00261BB883|nr:glycosyltransferase [uncultured Thiothrix sp.]
MTILALHIYRTYFPDPPGGLQEAIRQITISTKSFGIESKVFALSPHPTPNLITLEGVDIVRSRSWATLASCDIGGLDSIRRFISLFKEADVIHYHYPWPFADFMNLLGQQPKPKVMTYHSDIVRQNILGKLYNPLMRHTLKTMDRVIATSSAYTQTSPTLSKYVNPERIRVIPLGIDENSYSHTTSETSTRFSLKSHVPFFLFIGVLRYYKGLHTLIEAATQVNASIIIAGTGQEDARLRRKAELCNATNVIFAGQITNAEKIALLKACCALVLPSHLRSEAYGMVLVEASMFSKPMISCEIGTGTSFINKDQETGFVVPPESPIILAKKMNALLTDNELNKSFGRAARQRYETYFSGPALGKSYADLYYEVLAKK